MNAYIDETGNTGPNLFDPAQPTFLTLAFITRGDFDQFLGYRIVEIAKELNKDEIHSNMLTYEEADFVAFRLLDLLSDKRHAFQLCRVVKRDLCLSKFVDTVFDSGENIAVPWHVYNLKPYRLLILLKTNYILTEDHLKRFWVDCLMQKKESAAEAEFKTLLEELIPRADLLPDARSRQIISETFSWAKNNPKHITKHSSNKDIQYSHLPNLAVFPELLSGIERRSVQWRSKVQKIVHDEQSQFGRTLAAWHELHSNKTLPKFFEMPWGEKLHARKVVGSTFKLTKSEHSPGVQVADFVLWIYSSFMKKKELPSNCNHLIAATMNKCGYYDLSLQTMENFVSKFIEDTNNVTDEQIEKGKELIAMSERKRQQALLDFEKLKLTS